MRLILTLCGILAIALLLTWLWAWQDDAAPADAGMHQIEGEIFNTSYLVKIRATQVDSTLEDRLDEALHELSGQMSVFDAQSEISAINQAQPHVWVGLSPEMQQLLAEAHHVYQMSQGCFDPTISPLIDIWGFGRDKSKRGQIPSEEEIADALAQSGFDKIRFRDNYAELMKAGEGLSFNLSAIAKGYAVDRLKEILHSQGYSDFLIEIGGEIYASGTSSATSKGWVIGITHPSTAEQQSQYQERVLLHNEAIASSGNYRNYFDKDGKRYAHTISPQTGKGIDNGVLSVSVISSSCMRADAIATAIMAMPAQEIDDFIKRNNLKVILYRSSE